MMKPRITIALAAAFFLVTFLRFDVIRDSLLSIAVLPVVLISNARVIGEYWNTGIIEYWVAALSWCGIAFWFLVIAKSLRLERAGAVGSGKTSSTMRAEHALALVIAIALSTPFLVPVDPNIQGNLVTTRLLPPLSIGRIREYVEHEEAPVGVSGSATAYIESTHRLLHSRIVVNVRPEDSDNADLVKGMDLVRDGSIIFLFGTDDNGRDVFSRAISGARLSLAIGIFAALGSLVIGGVIGFAAGMSRGALDPLLMRLTDLFLAIPSLFLVIGVLAFVGQSFVTLILVLAVTGWMGIARVTRGETISLREREFILAARMLRVSPLRIVVRHMLPNLGPVLITATVLQFANAILGEAALGFLGLGIQPPTATWGNMMGESMEYLPSGWWIGVFPGMFLAALLVLAHSIGQRERVNDLSL